MTTDPHPLLTVVICTYNRAFILEECLRSLMAQDCSSEAFDVLVVDNNSTDETCDLVERLMGEWPGLGLVREGRQGLSHARNRGLREARTEWVAYLDDDARASPHWVSRILEIIWTRDYVAFGGPYLPWYRDGRVAWYRDEYGTNLSWMPYTEVTTLEERCFSGGNAVYRRGAALAAGGFPVDLGMCGEALGYGEENVLQRNLRRAGGSIGFDPELIIYHWVPLKKQTLAWFCERKRAEGNEYLRQQQVQAGVPAFLLHAAAFAWRDSTRFTRAAWRFLTGEYRWQNLYIEVVPTLIFQKTVLGQLLSRGG